MAAQGKGPLLLTIVLLCLLNYSHQTEKNDVYGRYTYTGEGVEDLESDFQPLLRLKRDEEATAKTDEEATAKTDEEATAKTKEKDLAKSIKKASYSNKSDLSDVKKKPLLKKESKEIKHVLSSTTTTTTTTTPMPSTIHSTPSNNNYSSAGAAVDSIAIEQQQLEDQTHEEKLLGGDDHDLIPHTKEVATVPSTDVDNETSDEDEGFNSLPFPDGGENIPYDNVGDTRPFSAAKNATLDHHRYYKSETYIGHTDSSSYWVELDHMAEEVTVNKMLSDSHRRAATVTLKFEFPFYGHMLRNITIATGGFLFTGNFVHTWLAATQYIAPLMANFDTSLSEDAVVKYADNGNNFTVQWDKVVLKDHKDAGSFTFQVTLHRTGDIVFVYKDVPVIVSLIQDKEHPVKVGLSDAYIVDRTIFYVRRKTIYEYHKIDMKKAEVIGNWTAIHFRALPTCVSYTNCTDCLNSELPFECQWCNKIGRCSNGLDRHRQEWLHSGCEALQHSDVEDCKHLSPPPPRVIVDDYDDMTNVNTNVHDAAISAAANKTPDESSGFGTVVGIIFLVGLIIGLVGWVSYAYFFPHSASGQMLIKYRPSTWSWRRGEARYTAAAIHSIHM